MQLTKGKIPNNGDTHIKYVQRKECYSLTLPQSEQIHLFFLNLATCSLPQLGQYFAIIVDSMSHIAPPLTLCISAFFKIAFS